MKKYIQHLSLLFLLVLIAPVGMSQDAFEQFYTQLKPVQPTQSGDKIEVVEIFWYGCPHCYTFEPYINKWKQTKPDDVAFRRMPGVLGRAWIPHAKAYYVAEKLGVVEQLHEPLFTAIHKDRKRIFDDAQVRQFFLDKTDVNAADFDKAYSSKEIDIKVRQALSIQQKARITGVPSVIINGKYLTSPSKAKSNENLLKVIDHLVDTEREG